MAIVRRLGRNFNADMHEYFVLRRFAWGAVYQVRYCPEWTLLVREEATGTGTLYVYLEEDEFRADVRKVLNFGDGTAGAGVPEPDRPNPPTLRDALRFPSLAAAE